MTDLELAEAEWGSLYDGPCAICHAAGGNLTSKFDLVAILCASCRAYADEPEWRYAAARRPRIAQDAR